VPPCPPACRPEFLNRLDEIIVFRQLTKVEVKQIADIMLKQVFKRVQSQMHDITEYQATEKFDAGHQISTCSSNNFNVE
jgi:ATP-dependent Clp protease ATP-binding subunit ClpC